VNRKAVAAVTMVVLVGLLVAGAWYGWQQMSAPVPGSDEPQRRAAKPRCEDGVARGDLVRPADVTVSVYNAGSRSGLADQTLSELAARGFIRGDVGNAPANLEVVQFVRVLAPTKDDPTAKLVALQFGPNTMVQQVGVDLGPGIEVVVGDNFSGLVKAPTQIKAARATAGC
jgi:LytR cell envelope-related transcriptional attenuator